MVSVQDANSWRLINDNLVTKNVQNLRSFGYENVIVLRLFDKHLSTNWRVGDCFFEQMEHVTIIT